MSPSLEWTGYVPAAVSAVHALGALVHRYRPGAVRWRARRVQVAGGSGKARRGRCVSRVLVVRVDIPEEGAVTVRLSVGGVRAAGSRAGGGERACGR